MINMTFINPIIREDMENIYDRFENWDWLKRQAIFITGAYGMLASYLTFFFIYLNERNPDLQIQIYAQGRNEKKMEKRFSPYTKRGYFHVVTDDICSELKLSDKIDYIVHAASLASPQYYAVNPTGTLLPNTIGTYHLLEFARKQTVKSFLFFSSGDVYGVVPENIAQVTETDFGYIDTMNIRSCYGESKRMGETMCKAWSSQFGVPAKCVRIYHTYGPTMDIQHDQRSFSEFVKNIVNCEDILMKSDGKSIRSFCYSADAVDGFLRILQNGQPGEAYNLCNNAGEISIKDLAELLVRLQPEKKLKVIQVARTQDDVYLESPVKKTVCISTEKLQRLGWKPTYRLEKGFLNTIRSFEWMRV